MSAPGAATSAQILQHITAFISETLSQSDLRRRIFSTFRQKHPSSDQNIIRPLNLAADTLENAISTANISVRSSSLRLAEKLLNSYPQNPFSSFLLSLIYSLCHRPIDSALSLLEVFYSNPSLSRSEIAPVVFEELFLVQFLPVLQWYNEQRSRILSSLPKSSGYDSDDQSICVESAGVSCTTLLSKMNGDQASELKELERDYEDVLDENCRVFVWYFKEVLENGDEGGMIDPPSVVLETLDKGDEFEYSDDDGYENIEADESELKNGRYNPIWAEEEKSVEFKRSMTKNLSKFPSFFPERVSLKVLTNQKSSRKSRASFKKDSDSELETYAENGYSSTDSEGEKDEKDLNIADSRQSQSQNQEQPNSAESSRSPDPVMADSGNPPGGGKHAAPKDFVCPITSNIFDDPVTLETRHTYEQKAIQEWIDRGNSTCPIT